jgi:hypothetical protein
LKWFQLLLLLLASPLFLHSTYALFLLEGYYYCCYYYYYYWIWTKMIMMFEWHNSEISHHLNWTRNSCLRLHYFCIWIDDFT